jgi:CARDB
MARRNRNNTYQHQSSIFEIVVILSIVLIVAITGQVLLHYQAGTSSSTGGSASPTGFVVSETGKEKADFLDLEVKSIKINPPSPIVGEPFDVKVTIANQGFTTIETPFYVQVKLVPNGEDVKPVIINQAVAKTLAPNNEALVSFQISMISAEGPLRVIAIADYTKKLNDQNPSNDQLSKTVVINIQ